MLRLLKAQGSACRTAWTGGWPQTRAAYCTRPAAVARAFWPCAANVANAVSTRGAARVTPPRYAAATSLIRIADDIFDLLLYLRRAFFRDPLRLHVFGDLLDTRSAGDHRAYMRILQDPGDGKLPHRAAEFIR